MAHQPIPFPSRREQPEPVPGNSHRSALSVPQGLPVSVAQGTTSPAVRRVLGVTNQRRRGALAAGARRGRK